MSITLVRTPGFLSVLLSVCAVAMIASACSLSANWPETTCGPDLDLGTICVPEAHRALDLFADVASETDAATARMADPLAGAINTQCFSLPPDVYTVCVSSDAGVTVITPVVMPANGRVSFEGDPELDTLDSVRLEGPLGLRRENAQFTVLVRDADDALLGTIKLGFYP